jgi:hypothetical protein
MMTFESLDTWIISHIAWWVPYGLVLCIPILLAWFPGANARLHGHDCPWAVSSISWLLALATSGVLLHTDFDVLPLLPTFITLWTGIAVWSYGKRDLPTVTGAGRGFEIIFPHQFLQSLELQAAE